METQTIALDTILSAVDHHTQKWSQGIESNKAGRLLRYLIIRLYDAGRGHLMNTSLTLAQTTLAEKLEVSRRWTGVLVGRLGREGWLEYESSKLPDGMNSSSVWRIGRMLKRLLIMLAKSKRGRSPISKPTNKRFHFSPRELEKRILSILEREKEPPKPETIERIPLLGDWLKRGGATPSILAQ